MPKDRRRARVLALLTVVGYALLAGWWTPRGPVSTFQGLAAMGLGLLVGLVAGLLLTGWAMALAPLGFAVVFELARLRASGPTVDGIHFGSTYGVIALRGRPRHARAPGPAADGAGSLLERGAGAARARDRTPATGSPR